MIRPISPARYWFVRIITTLLVAGAGVLAWDTSAAGAPFVARPTAARPHPVHVTSTQVELSRDERRLMVTVRIFTDDLEDALKAIGHPVVVANGPAASVDSALTAFLRDRLRFALDGRPAISGRITGHERETEATLVFLEVRLTATPTRMAIVQRVFLDRFDDQVNLIHVRFGTKKRSALVRRGNERAEFTL